MKRVKSHPGPLASAAPHVGRSLDANDGLGGAFSPAQLFNPEDFDAKEEGQRHHGLCHLGMRHSHPTLYPSLVYFN